MSQVTFTVYRKVEPQGSKHGFIVPGKNGGKARAVVVDVNKSSMRSFRADLRNEAMIALQASLMNMPMADREDPVEITMEFMFVRPKSCKKRQHPSVKPDIDKCIRSCLDAMTGVVFVDDAQVVTISVTKVYGPTEKVQVSARAPRDGMF